MLLSLCLKQNNSILDNPITTIVGGSQKNATEGDTDVSLECTAESKPPAKFTWHKTGDSSPIKTGTGTADNNRLVYTIPTVNRQHAGTYGCTADNVIPSPDSAEQELIVFCKLVIQLFMFINDVRK